MNLKEALSKLDSDNDDHWTQEGLPRLDVLKTMTGQSVTRSDIFEISKKFNRYNTSLEGDEVIADETESEDVEVEEAEVEPEVEAEQVVVTAKEGEPENFALIEKAYKEAQLELQAVQKKFEAARDEYDHVIRFREQAKANVPHSQVVKAYQAAQAKNREALIEKVKLVKSLTNGLSEEQKAALKQMG